MQQLIGRTEKQLILQRCKRQNWKYYTTEDVTCPTVDAFPVRYYFTHLIFWQKHHKKHLHATFVFRPDASSHSCHRPAGLEDPYHISLFLPGVFFTLSPIVAADVFTGEQEATVCSPMCTPPLKKPAPSCTLEVQQDAEQRS